MRPIPHVNLKTVTHGNSGDSDDGELSSVQDPGASSQVVVRWCLDNGGAVCA